MTMLYSHGLKDAHAQQTMDQSINFLAFFFQNKSNHSAANKDTLKYLVPSVRTHAN